MGDAQDNGRLKPGDLMIYMSPYREQVSTSHAKVDRNVCCKGDAYDHAMPTSVFVSPISSSRDTLRAGSRGLRKGDRNKGNMDMRLMGCIAIVQLARYDLCRCL
jgi:hypothetical protein